MITKDNAKQWLPLVQAMAEGKMIQVRGDMGGWFDVVSGCLTELHDGAARYRIKPEPKLRAWEWAECPQNFIVRNKAQPRAVRVAVRQNGFDHVRFFLEAGEVGQARIPFDELLRDWIRIAEDGTEHPCGVMEVEP